MSYKHHYAMLLPVGGMIETGPIGLTPERVAEALRLLAAEVEAGTVKLDEMLGRRGPVAAEQEDRWVLRAADRPNIIRKAAGGWVEVDSTMIDLEDTVTGEVAARMLMKTHPDHMDNSVFVRPENIGGKVIKAEFRTEGKEPFFRADIRDFIAFADDEMVHALAAGGWQSIDPEGILTSLEETHEPAVLATQRLNRNDPVVPIVQVIVPDPEAASAFLRECRPDLHRAVYPDATPGL